MTGKCYPFPLEVKLKNLICLLVVAMVLIAPVSLAFAQDELSPPETVTMDQPQPPEGGATDIFSAIGRFFDMLVPLIPWALLATVLFIAIWVYFDASRRTSYGWVWGLASLLIIPWLVYLAWRPSYTIEEQKMMESDANLRRIEKEYYQYALSKEKFICTVCGTPIQPDYQVCPNCFKELKKVCPSCNRLLDPEWRICPYCAARVLEKPKGA